MRVQIARRPDIPAPVRRTEFITISGRDGTLVMSDGAYDDIDIPIEMNFLISDESWGNRFRKTKQWLLSGGKKLILSDDASVFYRVKDVRIEDMERTVRRSGQFTCHFICEPHTYIVGGQREYKIEDVRFNPYLLCKPIYKFTGEGMCTLTVNGKSMKANVGQNLTVDTEMMLAYRSDGTLNNTEVMGDYEDLYLQSGENSIYVTGGFNLKIIPNWRCL